MCITINWCLFTDYGYYLPEEGKNNDSNFHCNRMECMCIIINLCLFVDDESYLPKEGMSNDNV